MGTSSGGESEAAAITWKIEAEKATREAERWKELARKSEEATAAKDETVLQLRAQAEGLKLRLEGLKEQKGQLAVDERPQADIDQALQGLHDDLNAKNTEASQLRAKVARLE